MVCASLENINDWLNVDDGLEVFKLHAVGGMVGSFLTGVFAQKSSKSLFLLMFFKARICVKYMSYVTNLINSLNARRRYFSSRWPRRQRHPNR